MLRFSFLLLATAASTLAADRTVAITIDDLPFAHSGPQACRWDRLSAYTKQIVRPLHEQHVPATAFVVGQNCPDLNRDQRRAILQEWRSAGVALGNHTFSHISLHQATIEAYEKEILRTDRLLRSLLGEPVRWFRSPFLHTGNTLASKTRLERFLSAHGYRQAPVTLDNSDWLFANVYADALERRDEGMVRGVRAEYVPYLESVVAFFEQLSLDVTGREIPQVLLLHANRLNADLLPDILSMFRRRGYRFVTLEQAMADRVYQSGDTYVGDRGISWLRRWALTQGKPDRAEPEDPEWLVEAFKAMSRR